MEQQIFPVGLVTYFEVSLLQENLKSSNRSQFLHYVVGHVVYRSYHVTLAERRCIILKLLCEFQYNIICITLHGWDQKK